METFSLLKYWKGGAALTPPSSAADTTTAIPCAVAQNVIETDDDDNENDEGDDGPFFDLEFTVPDEDEPEDSEDANENQNDVEEEDDDDDNNNNDESEREFKFTFSPSSNDTNLSPSASDDLFVKGNLLLHSSEPNSKPQLSASLIKSATKFRVFMLGLKKSKPNNMEPNTSESSSASNPQQPEPPKKLQQRKLFTVKFKIEETPIVSLFTRDNSSRACKASQNQKQQNKEESQTPSSASDEKRLMHRYLKMVKPLYVRVSRRHAEKLKLSEQHNVSLPESGKTATPQAQLSLVAEKAPTEADGSETAGTNMKVQKQGNNIPLPAGLRVVCKHLGKSRSASSSAATSAAPASASVSSRRRDDSLLQQQDGIQGAILHCKRSFNASRGKNDRMRVFSAGVMCERDMSRIMMKPKTGIGMSEAVSVFGNND
ncbi:hypothetical protein VNO77_00498 [Canavalia gladiata]|uniref:Membrane-associated kinase regulator 2 n=1 Tax=Canavalia gladiata TaxID=3824 RepID=A0AAN9R1D8_CANGL